MDKKGTLLTSTSVMHTQRERILVGSKYKKKPKNKTTIKTVIIVLHKIIIV